MRHINSVFAGADIMRQMDHALPLLIQALMEPRRYPGGVPEVELVQTHISWVLLAGDFAYKIKKPVKLHFLDFSTLEQRRVCCDDELRLNRRFAPDIYLDVVGIFNTPQDPQFEGPGAPIEYAVRMRRFDESGRLDHVCARGELRSEHLSDLAETLVAFHSAASIAPPSSRFGTPREIMTQAMDNFSDLLPLLPDAGVRARLGVLRAWSGAQFADLAPLMETRKRTGHIRECHGDLHLANLVLMNHRVRMFDCIEFNEDLRWIDVAGEIAFTYVDLLAHVQPGLANWFVDEVLSRSGDYEIARLLRFYAVYRALVLAKVAAIRRDQMHAGYGETEAFIGLAERLAAPPPARLLITHGLSGSGKTMATNRLLQSDAHASTLRVRSDVERKRLFGLGQTEKSGSPTGGGTYTRSAQVRTYTHLRNLAEKLLQAGWSVIVDATFLKRVDRDAFRGLAKDCNVEFFILAPQATHAQLRARILARRESGRDASEATVDVLAQQMQTIEPLEVDERRVVLVVSDSNSRIQRP
jgi:aminoglycoside phosphotransferase family enzyme/predicted kinase